MERIFGADLSDVRLHASPLATIATRKIRTLAFTVRNHIVFGSPVMRLPSSHRLVVLTHELAHVLQKRLSSRTGETDEVAAEHEAAEIGLRVGFGQTASCRIASDPDYVSRWSEAGHYYTVYFVMLAAGATPRDARHIAFFAQMPDEVLELDAKTMGVALTVRPPGRPRLAQAVLATVPAISLSMLAVAAAVPFSVQNIPDSLKLAIQKGLHALTGRPAEEETARRAAILKSIDLNLATGRFDFGMGLHAYGDSFAHRKGNNMYSPPIGHARDNIFLNSPDEINEHTKPHYGPYVGTMYAVAAAKFPPMSARLSRPETVAKLLTLCTTHADETAKAGLIREWSRQLMGAPMDTFDPLPDGPFPFEEFMRILYASVKGVNRSSLFRGWYLARAWTSGSSY